jgi:hypothetical protein
MFDTARAIPDRRRASLLAILCGSVVAVPVKPSRNSRAELRPPSAAPRVLLLTGLALALCVATPALADTIYLRNGEAVRGRVTTQTRTEIRIQTAEGARTIPKNQIVRITFERYEEPARTPEKPREPSGGDRPQEPAPTSDPNAPESTAPGWGAASLARLNAIADWFSGPRPERAELRLGAGPVRSEYQSAFENTRSSLNEVGSLVSDNGQATIESPFSNRRLNGYGLFGEAAWRDFTLGFAYSDLRGASEFTDLRLQRQRQPSTIAATSLLSRHQTRGLRQQNRRFRLTYSVWRDERHDLALGVNWLRMDFRFDTELLSGFSPLDSSLAPFAGGAIALPGQSFQTYQRGYAASLHWRWSPLDDFRIAIEWLPPFRRRGEMWLSQTSGAYVDLGTSQNGRINNSLLDFDYVAYESGAGVELQYGLNEYTLVSARMDYRSSRYDLEQFTISGTEYDLNSGLFVGSGPNVIQALFFSGIFSPVIQPRELDRQYSLSLLLRVDFTER